MGGPAMIEGGGLGTLKPEEVGPIDVQSRNGVVDVRVRDEVEAVAVEAIADPAAREETFQSLVAAAYEQGKAINMASLLEIDAVIDPAETRAWILRGLRSVPKAARAGRRRVIDTW